MSGAGADGGGSKRRHLAWWQESLLLLVIAVAMSLLIKTFLLQAFYIPSPSMEPGLVKNDRILVEKPSYWFGEPQRGDVVVFKDPGDWLPAWEKEGPTGTVAKALSRIGLYPTGGHLVKRVIGVAGDTIVCCDKRGRLSINGEPLNEDDYVLDPDTTKCRGPEGPGNCNWTAGPVPEDHLFLLGDNRANSADSSYHLCAAANDSCDPADAFIDTDLVVGRVFSVIWPRDHWDWTSRPGAFEDVPEAVG